jgi:multiple sugar transport system permease protein
MKRKSLGFFALFLLPTIVILVAVTLLPIIYGVFSSLHTASLSDVGRFVGLKNYIRAFTDVRFYQAFRVTLVFVVGAVGLELLAGMVIAVLLYESELRTGILKTLFLISMATTPAVVGILWRLMLDMDFGIINQLLDLVGIGKVPWLVKPTVALFSLIIVDVWEWTPFIILILYAGLQSIPVDIYEAAAIDGAAGFRRFFKLTLPLLYPLVSIAVFLRAIDAYKMFDIAYITTSGGPGTATENASLFAYRQGFSYFRTGYASACAIIMLVLVMLVDLARNKISKRLLDR